VCYENVGLPYGSGGMVCRDAGVCGGDATVPVVGVFIVWFGTIFCNSCACKKVMV